MRTIIKMLMLFGILMTVAIFGFLFVQSIIGENIIQPIGEELIKISDSQGLDARVNAGINQGIAFYDNFSLKADLLFLISWVGLEVLIFSLAVSIPRMPTFNFLSYILFGTMILMFVLDFITQITTWITINLINGIFDASLTYLPIFNFYQNYQYIIVFLNFITVLLINIIFSKGEETKDALDFNNPQPINNMNNAQEVIEE